MLGLDGARGFWFPEAAAIPDPLPLDVFLFKIASRCNLACTYCYVYELQDQGWRAQPVFMDEHTLRTALERIRTHVVEHSVPSLSVIFHGGEPLLVGPQRLDEIASLVHERLDDVAAVKLGMQTNGTLLDERVIEVALRHGIRIGLSVDGPPRHHDAHRPDHEGRGTSERVQRAAALLSANRDAFGGVLCVIDLDADPAELFDYFSELGPSSMDLLLPHATYDHLPPGARSAGDVRRYGEWLIRFLERWYVTDQARPDIRFFSSIMKLFLGRPSAVESIGVGLSSLVVVESNGDIEAVDSLKACFDGAATTGLNVHRDSFDAALRAPAIMSRQMGTMGLCDTCRRCPYLNVCGGGYQPHRYSASNGFLNPSIYCETLQMLISRIAELMRDDLTSIGAFAPSAVTDLANARLHAAGI